MACAIALAGITKLDVPDEVKKAYPGREFKYGQNYVIPTPFDPRLITTLPVAVAKAAIKSGVASHTITDWDQYAIDCKNRLDPKFKVSYEEGLDYA